MRGTSFAKTWAVVRAVSIPVLFLVALFAWALSSPVGSSPDDDFHLSSIWCGLGDREGLCEPADGPDSRMVPGSIASKPCFARVAETNASCISGSHDAMAEATWMNANGLYPELFYAVHSPMASDNVQLSVVAIRMVNAAISVGILTVAFWLLPTSLRPALVLSFAVTLVPLGLFLLPSTNPSSWAVLSAPVVFLSFLGVLKSDGRRRMALGVLAVLGTVVGAGARADAATFAVFAMLLAWVVARRSVSRPALPLAISGAIVVSAVGFFLSAGQGGSAAVGLPNDAPALSVGQHVGNFLLIPVVMWGGAVGGAPMGSLGWLDTDMPMAVPLLMVPAVICVLVVGLRRSARPQLVAFASAMAALWIIPFVLLAQTHAVVGTHVQPRYILPLLALAVAVATSASPVTAWSGMKAWLLAGAVGVAGALALHANLQRYTTGQRHSSLDPGQNAQWWWDLPISPLAVWLIGSTTLFIGLFLVASTARSEESVSCEAGPSDSDVVSR